MPRPSSRRLSPRPALTRVWIDRYPLTPTKHIGERKPIMAHQQSSNTQGRTVTRDSFSVRLGIAGRASRHRLLLTAAAVGCLAMLPGCIVWDIHDQIATTNDRIQSLEDELALISEVNKQLVDINKDLDGIQQQLTQLSTLESITESLKKLDAHLASLRKTISNIDSTIPFLKLSSDDETEETDQADTAEPGAEPTGQAEPAGSDTTQQGTDPSGS